jgi:hypothetical protein
MLAEGLEQISGGQLPAEQVMQLAQEAIQLEMQAKQQEQEGAAPVPSAEPPTMP